MKNSSISANDYYNHFIGTECYYAYLMGLVLTDGVKAIADEEQCYWFLDCIVSYQLEPTIKEKEFQVWKIERIEDTKFKLTATNGNNKILVSIEIPFSDFFFNEYTIWKEGNVLLLPSEH